jgi:GNAT superfamily N-acetyltransferase
MPCKDEENPRQTMSFVIQTFSKSDMDQTDVVLRAAYRTQFGRKDSLKRYLEIENCYALVAQEGKQVVGFGGIIDYGPFSYIGLMAADPKVQRKGIGAMILDGLLSWAKARQCPTVLLSASSSGVHLYEKTGFIHLDRTDLLQRNKLQDLKIERKPSENYELDEKNFPSLVSFDAPLFGANRGALLHSYYKDDPSRFLVSRDKLGKIDGFLVAQERTLGPWIVNNSRSAEGLLSRALQLPFADAPTVFVSELNEDCLQLLARKGFELQRSLSHMYLGKEIQRARATAIFGEATLGFG